MTLRSLVLATAMLLIAAPPDLASESEVAPMRDVDRVRIAEVLRLGHRFGDRLWDGWQGTTFAVLLVTPEREYLVGHPEPSADFVSLGKDSRIGSEVFARARQYSTGLLASFPAVSGSPVPVIVVGQAENTQAASSGPWVITLQHEHFHQMQMSRPDYTASVTALDLEGEDTGGMWMLDYPFPYEDEDVGEAFAALTEAAARSLEGLGSPRMEEQVRELRRRWIAFADALDPADRRYFGFQIWQEGIARYTQMRVAQWAARRYRPSRAFRELDDFEPFDAADDLDLLLRELRGAKLSEQKRVAFYPLGAAAGLILDAWNPDWRERYFTEKFAVDRFFDR